MNHFYQRIHGYFFVNAVGTQDDFVAWHNIKFYHIDFIFGTSHYSA